MTVNLLHAWVRDNVVALHQPVSRPSARRIDRMAPDEPLFQADRSCNTPDRLSGFGDRLEVFMTTRLLRLDYEQLAARELERAAGCRTNDRRSRHLNRAAAYASLGEKAGPGSARSEEVLSLIGDLSVTLDNADALGEMKAALYIDQAIIDLGGISTPPPEWSAGHDEPISTPNRSTRQP
ncbi:hypothetical protein HL653_06030 [Sphingomonas sp. AP4-R1]|uniref:hypothetical protein n=1 Tax=Sphingomonas sp. AP4-R1 TaxID=2735134 RepID=UPI0014938BC9|nr:hypothetical protein [Sphingomonas sp. AP4-R1]QJU57408.1 hypothetical protein HL653_06030 [Sphingomonas sp. AP4-R1]